MLLISWRKVQSFACLLVFVGGLLKADELSSVDRFRRDLAFLASDACEGRGVETRGINLAADYIAAEFTKVGLKGGGAKGQLFQPFEVHGAAAPGSPISAALCGPDGATLELKRGTDFQIMGLSGSGTLSAPIVFAGYGVSAPNIGYDDFKDVDVTGKVVMLLGRAPHPRDAKQPFDGNLANYHGLAGTKLANARLHKAAGVILINDRDTAAGGDRLREFRESRYENSNLPVIQIHRRLADRVLHASLDKSLEALEDEIDRDQKPHRVLLPAWSAKLDLHVLRPLVQAKNIAGVVEGSGTLADETIVVGAHYDHLGYGEMGSLAGNAIGQAIHHGADDNGSGTTALLELARRFARLAPVSQARRLVFIAFSGEERGLLGSAYYCKHPLFPLESTAAMVNLDMIGRLRPNPETHQDRLQVEGSGTAANFDQLLEDLNRKYNFQLSKKASGQGPSDHASFYQHKIPVLFYWTGYHSDYHKPSDTADKINLAGMAKVVDFAEDTIRSLREAPQRPVFVQVKSAGPSRTYASGPRLGIVPDYSDDQEGVRLAGVTDEGLAKKAGLRAGDRIVEMAGKPVHDLEGYMAVMAGQRPGGQIDLVIVREGKRIKFHIHFDGNR